jgi:hypothetical protein
MYDAEDVFELPNSHDQTLKLDDLVKIRKQSVPEEAEELVPEPTVRTTTVLKSNEWLGLTEGGMEVFGDCDWSAQRAGTTGQLP